MYMLAHKPLVMIPELHYNSKEHCLKVKSLPQTLASLGGGFSCDLATYVT